MEVQFSKGGNSIGLRVPAKVAQELGIAAGSIADLEIRKDRIVMTPRSHAYRLDDLLTGITPENVHHEITTDGLSAVLADQVKSLDWRARSAKRKGRVSDKVLAEVTGILSALIL